MTENFLGECRPSPTGGSLDPPLIFFLFKMAQIQICFSSMGIMKCSIPNAGDTRIKLQVIYKARIIL